MNSTALTRSIIQKPISVTAELVVSAAHDELAKAPKADGKVAEVAQVVDALLHPHLLTDVGISK